MLNLNLCHICFSFYLLILISTDPQEVAEWRNQRRKKFPTKQAIEEKKAREKLRLEAGGLVTGGGGEEDVEGEHCRDGRGTKKRARELQGVSGEVVCDELSPKHTKSIHEEKEFSLCGTPCDHDEGRGSPTSFVQLSEKEVEVCDRVGNGVGDSDQMNTSRLCASADVISGASVQKNNIIEIVASATSSVCASPVVNSSTNDDTVSIKSCLAFQKKGRCKYGKKCHFMHDDYLSLKSVNNNKNSRNNGKGGKNDKQSSHKTQNLYGKLVKDDIEKEDNMILQCLRYFVLTKYELKVHSGTSLSPASKST